MLNPQQSRTHNRNNCAGNKCVASKAIDGDWKTGSLTTVGGVGTWWKAELEKTIKITNMLIYAGEYYFDQGYYQDFKIETGAYICVLSSTPGTYSPNSLIGNRPLY